MKNTCFASCVLFLITATTFAQFDTDLLSDWRHAGINAFLWPKWKEVTLNCDEHNCDEALQSLLNESRHPLVINIPEGNYVFKKAINLPSHTLLRGEGSEKTVLIFDVPNSAHSITARAPVRSRKRFQLKETPQRNDTTLVFELSNAVKVGDHLRLIYNDEVITLRDWGRNTTGQLVRVSSVDGNNVYVDSPFRLRYSRWFDLHVEVIEPVEEVGIEQLSIIRRSPSDRQVSNVFFEGVYRGYLYGVRSDSCHYAHLDARTSRFIHVEKCYFNEAHDYGEGGKAYGVMLQMGTCDSRVTDNAFSALRHAMIVQAGANGNVFGYNYSTDVKATRVLFGRSISHTLSGDMVVHGNYPYANVFEGNRAHMGIIDNAHGENGPGNTYYRNHVRPHGITLTNPSTVNCVFIENSTAGLSFFLGARHFRQGNSFDISAARPSEEINSLGFDVFPQGVIEDFIRHIGAGSANDKQLPAEIRFYQQTFTPQSGSLLIHE